MPSQNLLSNVATLMLGLFISLTTVITLTFFKLPGTTLLSSALQNSAHSLVFFFLTLILFAASLRINSDNKLTNLFIVLIAANGIGLLIEFWQLSNARGFSNKDVVTNFSGAIAACLICVAATYFKKTTPRVLAVTTALSIILMCFSLPIKIAIASHLRATSPILEDFEHWGSEFRFIDDSFSDAKVVQAPTAWSENTSNALRLTFESRSRARLSLKDVEADWKAYKSLKVDVYVTQMKTLRVIVLVKLKNKEPGSSDVFLFPEIKTTVHKGHNSLDIKLDDFLAENASPVKLDEVSVSEATLLFRDGAEGSFIYVDNLNLN